MSGWSGLQKRLGRMSKMDDLSLLHSIGKKGVSSLSSATPVDSGETASEWFYEISGGPELYQLSWKNRNTVGGGIPVALLIQYGHGTRSGRYIKGIDFINPAMRPLYPEFRKAVKKEAGL